MRIFIGGPSDVTDETSRIFSLCNEISSTLEIITGQQVTVNNWSQVPPSQGKAQNIIFSESNFHDADVFVFVFWHRFGSPPGLPSEWRKKQQKINPNAYPSAQCASGTEAEIELALKVAKNENDRKRRVMIYRCVKPVPVKQIDLSQLQLLEQYFKDRIYLKTLAQSVPDLAGLEQRAYGDILLAAHHVAKLENRASHALKALHEDYNKRLSSSEQTTQRLQRLLYKFMVQECETTEKIISSILIQDRRSCKIRTTDLYDKILDMMSEAESVKIIDLDIKRWNELINDEDKIFTLNYSRRILDVTAGRCKTNDRFNLSRVFVIRKAELRDGMTRDMIIKIFDWIRTFISEESVVDRICVRVFFDDEAVPQTRTSTKSQFRRAQQIIESTQDIVLCETDGSKILLREDLSMDTPRSAFETWGEISALKKHIEAADNAFTVAWDLAWPLDDAITTLREVCGTRGSQPEE